LWAVDTVAVRAATDAAEAALGLDPYQGTTHQSEGMWWIVVPPVVVCFEIDPVGRRVRITDVVSAAPPTPPA
jgi:hypothetical protein